MPADPTELRLNLPVTANDVEELFKLILGRSANNSQYCSDMAARGLTVGTMIRNLLTSAEFKLSAPRNFLSHDRISLGEFRIPSDLSVEPIKLSKMLLIGECLLDPFERVIKAENPNLAVERIVFNNAMPLPAMSGDEASEYDFQIVSIPIRWIVPEHLYFSLKAGDSLGYERLFQFAKESLRASFTAATKYARDNNILTFVFNFVTPQQNPLGRMQDRYNLNNFVYLIEQLNIELHKNILELPNAVMIDFDQIIANFGKKYFQDDFVYQTNHGAPVGEILNIKDMSRLQPVGKIREIYETKVDSIYSATFREIVGNIVAIKQKDSIKLAIFDLDDTLWRGVAADTEILDAKMVEGWPTGILDAIVFLEKRGIMIGITSKNDESVASEAWNKLYGRVFSFDRFVSRKINWHSKHENITEMCREINILPSNTLFIDDNPVERRAVKEAIPGIRVIDQSVAHWRRILLWSPEMQVARITDEALRRTEMVQAQIKRDSERVSLGSDEFLRNLQLEISFFPVESADDARFSRCMELINKTNQFNTTGRRWPQSELIELFLRGGLLVAVAAKDIYTDYGIISVAVIEKNYIEQLVMSCRVFGMMIEKATVKHCCDIILDMHDVVLGRVTVTEKNRLARSLFTDCGFESSGDGLWKTSSRGEYPASVTTVLAWP